MPDASSMVAVREGGKSAGGRERRGKEVVGRHASTSSLARCLRQDAKELVEEAVRRDEERVRVLEELEHSSEVLEVILRQGGEEERLCQVARARVEIAEHKEKAREMKEEVMELASKMEEEARVLDYQSISDNFNLSTS